jgi:hypothetical protein
MQGKVLRSQQVRVVENQNNNMQGQDLPKLAAHVLPTSDQRIGTVVLKGIEVWIGTRSNLKHCLPLCYSSSDGSSHGQVLAATMRSSIYKTTPV